MVGAHPAEVECVSYILGVFLVLIRDVGITQLRIEGLLRQQLLFVHLLEAVHLLVRVKPFAYELTELPRLQHEELALEVFEALEHSFDQVLSEASKARLLELKASL